MEARIEATCRVCEASGFHPRHVAREMFFGTREQFEYFQCEACGCLQIAAIPSALDKFYPPGYYANAPVPDVFRPAILRYLHASKCEATFLRRRTSALKRLLTRFVRFPAELYDAEIAYTPTILEKARLADLRAPILDVGCGSAARWLKQLRSLGFTELVGTDPFLDARPPPRGIRLLRRELPDPEECRNHFSLIAFHHSLEHIPGQQGTLRLAYSLLAEGGVCLIRIPIVSESWNRYGVNWVELDAPRHLFLHSVRSICMVARSVGLELFDVVFDTPEDGFELYASEQYRRGVPLHSPMSHAENPAAGLFTEGELADFRLKAARANAEGTAGRAGYYFRKAPVQ